jgi:hypothetical protein
MIFEGSDQNILCDRCGTEINHLDEHPWFEDGVCLLCGAYEVEQFRKTPCQICGKPLGGEEVLTNEDQEYAHKRCTKDNDDWYEEDY